MGSASIRIAMLAVLGVALPGLAGCYRLPFFDNSGDMDLDTAREFAGSPIYYAGESFGGFDLTAITRRSDPPQPPDGYRANFVNFIYGDCEPTGDTGCAPPFQIQNWPACIRNLSSYTMGGRPFPHERVMVRGVPGAVFWQDRVEIYTGRTTVVIFASEDFAMRVADALVPVNVAKPETSDQPLPPPAEGAIDGELACTPAEYGPTPPPFN